MTMYSGDEHYGDDVTSPLYYSCASETDVARDAFYWRHAETLGGRTWQHVCDYLGHVLPYPRSAEEWRALGAEVRARRAQP